MGSYGKFNIMYISTAPVPSVQTLHAAENTFCLTLILFFTDSLFPMASTSLFSVIGVLLMYYVLWAIVRFLIWNICRKGFIDGNLTAIEKRRKVEEIISEREQYLC